MNGINNQYLIDSNIIIYHLNGEEIATNFLRENILNCFISRITFIEVLSFNFSINEKNDVINLLNTFTIIDTNEDISLQCLKNREIKKIKLPDNLIASTAQINNLILVTRNIKDFENLDIKVVNIF
ncbi:type II toxin-antitoxin system VapC family toxin [Arcobacter cloacae]|uniref:Nucleotide-binding protein n=1 Tax=Arcobacter cloacae TaxID=1054034 RepID=A0A6M8NJY6_9BACT|nr:type II toxin-antitoxin system VapC family toxin [Arcobacter cloacae]MCB9097540.1 type II toxin-antitoxin system VapC family toxin [Arcobacter sp.]QKF90829.1 PIN domain-containing protein [Arcobacter cloacae]RXI43167.1 nucleotide-binding protein [Arcobacter cloacae]